MGDADTPILFVGMGWFSQASGGLSRYVYELIHYLTADHNRIDFFSTFSTDLPVTRNHSSITLINLVNPASPLLNRIWSAYQ